MKKFLRFPLYAAMAAMMTFNFSACLSLIHISEPTRH